MPSLFSPSAPGRRRPWRLLSVLLALGCLTACQPGRAPEAASAGAEAPPASAAPPASSAAAAPEPASPEPAPPPVEAPPATPKPVPRDGVKSPKFSARPPAAGAGPVAGEAPRLIPRFSWPPPKASAQQAIPDKWLRTGPAPTLAGVADKFEKALKLAGYAQRSYYEVPHGFALATQLEQIHPDGTPMPGDDRWKVGPPRVGNLTLLAFIEALAHAPAGLYRVIVFVVTDAPWAVSTTPPSEDQIMAWAGSGAASLPAFIGNLPYGDDYRAHALIYEFRKVSSEPAETILPSEISGEMHLDRGGLWEPLSIL